MLVTSPIRPGTQLTVWFTGLPGAGKTTLARHVEAVLQGTGVRVTRLDGDELRAGPHRDLGFDREARRESCRRTAALALEHALADEIVLVALVSPYRSDRDGARARHRAAGIPFVEVHLDTPLALCAERDPKGLYRRAGTGELRGLTGVDDPYEPPTAPELVVVPDSPERQAARVLAIVNGV